MAPNGAITLLDAKQEGLIYFLHVYWSTDETKVGIVATGAIIAHLAYDLERRKEIPFSELRRAVAASIAAAYALPKGERDPVQWAAMHDAQLKFRARHPEFRPSYMR